jgi:hypothetical protein
MDGFIVRLADAVLSHSGVATTLCLLALFYQTWRIERLERQIAKDRADWKTESEQRGKALETWTAALTEVRSAIMTVGNSVSSMLEVKAHLLRLIDKAAE